MIRSINKTRVFEFVEEHVGYRLQYASMYKNNRTFFSAQFVLNFVRGVNNLYPYRNSKAVG